MTTQRSIEIESLASGEESERELNNVKHIDARHFKTTASGGKPVYLGAEVRLQTKFTSIFTLEKGKVFTADNPILMHERKTFPLSYKELEKHCVKVDMWRVSCWTFNEYYGVKKQKLSQIANRDPNMELRILRKLSRKQMADKKKAKSVADVALYRCTVNLEEIFDFDLFCALV